MTPELATLLDGPVAERFGRPAIDDELSMRWTDGWWYWHHVDYLDDLDNGIAPPVAAALWFAHLIGVCGERGLCVTMFPHEAGWLITVSSTRQCGPFGESNQPTALEALARAMLLVPEAP